MSSQIRQSESVKGISLCNCEIKVSQFAGDTNLFCVDPPSVENSLLLLREFGKISGRKLNIEKTKVM